MYTDFAHIYDKLMYDIDYPKWADYIESILNFYGKKPSLVLDLGCGTGSFCIEMAKRGYDMIGVDVSPDMLSCAKQKASVENLNILYLNQDMADFELYGTVDLIVCLVDSLNYVLHKSSIKRLFKLVKNYLNPGGLFIFDINTPYKLEQMLGNNTFFEIGDDITYIWLNSFDKRKRLCRFDLTFFCKQGQDYKRFDEVHYERAYTIEELKQMLETSGLILDKTYDNLTFSPILSKSERVFFICKS